MRRVILVIFGFFLLNLINTSTSLAGENIFLCECTSYNSDTDKCESYAIQNDSSCDDGWEGSTSSCLGSPQCQAFGPDNCEAICVESREEGEEEEEITLELGDFCDPYSDNSCGEDSTCAYEINSNLFACIRPNSLANGSACISSSECIGGGCVSGKDGIRVCAGGQKVPTCEGDYGIGFPSALGCFPFDSVQAAAASNVFLLGISGAIALILLARAAFIYMTSQGDPTKIAEAKSSITAVVAGILMLSFAVYILRFFGDTLLGLID